MTRSRFFKKIATTDNAGFTLIEAMIGLFVFTIGILAVIKLLNISINGNALARHNTEAAFMAASQVEDLRPLNYTKDAGLADGLRTLPDNDQYSRNYTVQRDAIIDNTMLIQVNVTWEESGRKKNVTLFYIKPDII